MKTILPQTTISYNSEQFLTDTLERLIRNKIISFYAFIYHEPEMDEAKGHFHVYIEPVNKIDTASLPDLFQELDPSHPDKPFRIMPLHTCRSWADWLWYSLHDKSYLLNKHENRLYHYAVEDFRTNDYDDFLNRYNETPRPISEYETIETMLKEGFDIISIIRTLNVPVRYFSLYKNAIIALKDDIVLRGEYHSHEIDNEQ